VAQGQFGNPEERESPPLQDAIIRSWVKTQQSENA
jgi:hypothetical protein